MPRNAGLVRLALLAGAAIALTGCSSSRDGPYQEFFQIARQSFAASMGEQRVSRDEAAAIPFASMGYRIDGGDQNLLVLASDTNGDQLWTAKTRIVILTRDGRIGRTVGLPHDVTAVTPQGGKPLPSPASALGGPVSSVRLADFPDISAYGVPLACSASVAGVETVIILGSAMRLARINENCRGATLHWAFVDNYWIDPQSGQVWRSIQHLHPKGEIVETEVFRPPG